MQLAKSHANVSFGNMSIDMVNEAVPKMKPMTAARLNMAKFLKTANLLGLCGFLFSIKVPLKLPKM
jgi:hypothetical protein